MNSPWHILEDVPAHSAAAAEWKLHLGDAYEAAKEAFLQKPKRKALSVQCRYVEGCSHELKPRGDGFVAKCKDDDGEGCDDFLVSADEAEVWEVNLKRLGAAIAGALKCLAKDDNLELDRTRQIASLGNAPLPILFTVQHDKDGFSDVVARLVARWPKGFVLLAPSSRFCTATATDMLDRVNAGFFDLETHVELLDSGKLHAAKSGEELFSPYLPRVSEATDEVIRNMGRFRYRDGFREVWFGDKHYDLQLRHKARFCIEYLVQKKAFDTTSARHLVNEIDPYVRKKGSFLPSADIKIDHYFTDLKGRLPKLRKDLIRAAGRNGKFYLKTD